MKTYTFIFEDKNQNELKREEWECNNIQETINLAKTKKANSMLNDLHKIKVRVK